MSERFEDRVGTGIRNYFGVLVELLPQQEGRGQACGYLVPFQW